MQTTWTGGTTLRKDALADIILDGRQLGTGSDFSLNKFKLIQKEEHQRQFIGMSSARTCLYMCDLVDDILREGLHADQPDHAKKLSKLFESDKSKLSKDWSKDTIKRYLTIGRRLMFQEIKAIIELWEFYHARETLIDRMDVLRAATGATSAHKDLAALLKILFLEQRSGLRLSMPSAAKVPGLPALMKGLILRGLFYVHSLHTFPKLADHVRPFVDNSHFSTDCGIDLQGGKISGWTPLTEDHEDAPQEMPLDVIGLKQSADASVYESKGPLLRLLKNIAKNMYQLTFMNMAVEMKKDVQIGELDLSLTSGGRLKACLTTLIVLYNRDFPVDKPVDTKTVVHITSPTHASDDAVTVTLERRIDTEEEYKHALAIWQNAVVKAENDGTKVFINSRFQWVVANDCDAETRAKKVKMCSLADERKRKLFDCDFNCSKPFPWDAAKRQKKSCFEANHYVFARDCLEGLTEVYSKVKTVDDNGVSDDVIFIVMQGGQPDEPMNHNLDAVVKQLKAVQPRLQKPRIGTIELQHVDSLRRQGRPKGLFSSSPDDNVVFTREKPGQIAVNNFQTLKADATQNKWPVTAIPFAQLSKATHQESKLFFGMDVPEIDLRDDGMGPDANADQLSLQEAIVIPFPREHSYLLKREAIQVFGVSVVVIYYAGAGESCKAVLTTNSRAIVVCESQRHKDWLIDNLTQFVKVQRLASVDPNALPKKPDELILWEKENVYKPSNTTPMTVANLPAMAGMRAEVPSFVSVANVVAVPASTSGPSPSAATPIVKTPTLLSGFGAGKL